MLTYKDERIIIDIIRGMMGPFLLFWLVVIFLSVYPLWGFIDNNQKINISCIKSQNECTIDTKKLLLGSCSQKYIFSEMGDAFLHNVGCTNGICYYNVQIPYKNSSIIKLYSSSENTKIQKWLIENFNKYKNDKNINGFKLNTDKQPVLINQLEIWSIVSVFILLVIGLFFLNIKYIIYIDKKNDFLIIENKRIIGKYKKKIPLSRIKDIELVKLEKRYGIKYKLLSGVDYEICKIVNPEEAQEVCNAIKGIVFS